MPLYPLCSAHLLPQVPDLYDPRTQWASYIINAIKAKELFVRDVNYIVKAGEIIIVDEFTGRTMQGRRWSDGLHQAVEVRRGGGAYERTGGGRGGLEGNGASGCMLK
jgi:preprotein translocase subunit SecA